MTGTTPAVTVLLLSASAAGFGTVSIPGVPGLLRGERRLVAGHVFVVHGDLTHLACDDWLVPSDRSLTLTDAWLAALTDDAVRRGEDGVPRLVHDAPEEFCSGGTRVLRIPDEARVEAGEGSPVTGGRAWLLDVGSEHDVDPAWLVDGVREWLDRVERDTPVTERARPLLTLPLIGTGQGGAADQRDRVLAELLPALREHAEAKDVDLALVLNDPRDHAAAQDVRLRLGDDHWDLPDDLHRAADELAATASAGRLSLFLGAGVSRAAGLPLWGDLLEELLDGAGVDEDDRAAAARLEVPDQAEYAARRLDGGGDQLRDWLRRRFDRRPHALAHALLAALPVRETVTTNWDPLFEQAVADAGRRLSVLPYDEPESGDGWLLKLHGDAIRGDDLVVRRSDYLRFTVEQQALGGVVQSLLFTRHMLFVGFSLVDENFIRIADDVTKIIDRYADQQGSEQRRSMGTTVGLRDDPAKPVLWPRLQHLVMGPDEPDDAERARRLEIFLDLLSARVPRGQAYLLDERYAELLDEPDAALAGRLAELAADDILRKSASWPRVQALLSELGHPGDDN